MRVLVGSKNAWNDMNAVGNTLSNFFGCQDNMEFASLYSRSELPANRVCGRYFRITETAMLKNIFTPEKIGSSFSLEAGDMDFSQSSVQNSERKAINFVKSHSLKPVYYLSDKLWESGKWINAKLKKFITDFNPDIFFSFATEPIILRQRMELVKELCSSKCVLFIADDVYAVYKTDGNKRVIDDFIWCLKNADLIYGASEQLCREYAELFGINISFLCKGCEVRDVDISKPLSPVRLIYAGNLFYGRDRILAKLIDEVNGINKSSQTKLFVEIYTASPVSDEMQSRLNVEGAGKVMGARAYDEIKEILHSAAVALQVESFDRDEIKKVRLSYSTKISDCLQSGSAVMAIGPNGIASIEYLKGVDGATVITDDKDIPDILRLIADNPQQLIDAALKTNEFAKKYHDIKSVRSRIESEFIKISEK